MPPHGHHGPRPEMPKDENGNPIFPTSGEMPEFKEGERPEPPKDENGNPMMPPHGNHGPRPDGKKPECCEKEENSEVSEIETAEV